MRILRTTPFIAATGCAVLFSGCFPRGGGGATLISSVSSDYSPVVSFSANVHVDDSIRVQVNSLRVLYPGDVFPGMGAVARAIEMQAMVVTENGAANGGTNGVVTDRNGTRKPWMERSTSEVVRLADTLQLGVPQTAGPLQLTLAVPAGVDVSESWIVFRITGAPVSIPARMADGSVMDSGVRMPPIRVFACAVKNLDGKTNRARARVMAEQYSAGC